MRGRANLVGLACTPRSAVADTRQRRRARRRGCAPECTFIVYDRAQREAALAAASSAAELDSNNVRTVGMVGDVNLFLNDPDDPHAAEIEVMIAGSLRASPRSPAHPRIRPSLTVHHAASSASPRHADGRAQRAGAGTGPRGAPANDSIR